MLKKVLACAAALAVIAAAPAEARTERVKVHGRFLQGNLEGSPAERDVMVFLPPSYDANPDKRYQVVYFLHGYSVGIDAYDGLVHFQEAVDEAAAAGNELIVVMPDANTKFKGAMFGASVTTGDFERFVERDLVGYIDEHYRTITTPRGRGLSGHSMGGYGALKIAMRRPWVFASIYAMAPCCLSPSNMTPENLATVGALTPESIANARGFDLVFPATLAAWAPDPQNPPYYVSTKVENGAVDPLLNARLHAHSPLVLLPQYLIEMKGLQALRLEVGDKDFLLRDGTWMHEELDRFGVAHEWVVFDGDHGNRVAARIRSELLPFFGQHLDK